ncbi:MAG: ABC transporter permease, partial [Anaerolineae bacterium]|nr:ABC transporter permease [Anaerolineae bacterium]
MTFWLKWSLRDLRERWLQVVAIALIIALGTGVYSGLGGQRKWRESSYDKNYSMLNMFDLHLTLTEGSYLEGEALQQALSEIEGVQTADVRLVMPTLVDASRPDESILLPGRIIGMRPEARVNQIYIHEGRSLTPEDSGRPTAVVDYLFARYYDLNPGDPIRVTGDHSLEFVGAGQSPEYFQIAPNEGMFIMGESSYAVLYMPLESLQTMVGREGLVNDAVVLVEPEANRTLVEQQLETVMAEKFPQTGFTLTPKEDDKVHSLMYGDAKQDQGMWNLIAFLFLIGAALAAFNLAGRIV